MTELLDNKQEARPRQMLVDISILYRDQAKTGIQRVVRSLWAELSRRAGDDFIVRPVYATRQHAYSYAPSNFLTERLSAEQSVESPILVQAGDIFLGLDFCPSLLPRHEKQIVEWKQKGVAINLLVYDLLPLQGPQWFGWKTRWNFQRWMGFLERQCDKAICISRTVAKDLEGHLKRCRIGKRRTLPDITHIRLRSYINPDGPVGEASDRVRSIFSRAGEKRTVLMVGTIEPRKAYDKALAAFEILWAKEEDPPCLIIVGKPGWKTKRLQKKILEHPENGRHLFWLQDSDDSELRDLYMNCSGLFYPSYGEGYGLPIAEAIYYGCPVLARDIKIFREVGYKDNMKFFQESGSLFLSDIVVDWLCKLEK